MDGDSDRSGGTCGLSDSGGLIDLSAVNSESPASKKGNSSLGGWVRHTCIGGRGTWASSCSSLVHGLVYSGGGVHIM